MEWLVAAGIVALLAGTAAIHTFVPAEVAFGLGLVLIAAGFLGGLPAGLVYHLQLFAALRPLPPRWWLRPTSFHGQLAGPARPRVLAWFYLGAAGVTLALAGAALAALGALR